MNGVSGSPHWSSTHYVAKDDLKHLLFLFLHHSCDIAGGAGHLTQGLVELGKLFPSRS